MRNRNEARAMRLAPVIGIALWMAFALLGCASNVAGDTAWRIGKPIVTYWTGPSLTDAVTKQMAEGNWNLVWCKESGLEIAQRHGLRVQLSDALLSLETLADPDKTAQLEALIERVRKHPALYSYYIIDEPSADKFEAVGKMVAFLRERDPAHVAHVNLFPTYATNKQLGNQGDTATAYSEHIRQYVEIVKPRLISYDHYHFKTKDRDGAQYFLNLAIVRQTALDAGVPFMIIIQARDWSTWLRTPTVHELRWLTYTALAYGAQGLSHFQYSHPGLYKPGCGQMMAPDGTPTSLYHAAKEYNREFAAIAAQLQPRHSLAAFHAGMVPPGAKALPKDAPFTFEPSVPEMEFVPSKPIQGMVLGYFGKPDKPSHVVVVNLNYKESVTTTVRGPAELELFDPCSGAWSSVGGNSAEMHLPPGGGGLLRLKP